MRKGYSLGLFLLFLWALFWLLLFAVRTKAQDYPPHVRTDIEQGCIELIDSGHYRMHIQYTSDGIEPFAFKMGDIVGSNVETLPYTGQVTTNIPPFFKTSKGVHSDWYVAAQSKDSAYTFNLIFTNDQGTGTLPVNTWNNVTWCEPGQYLVPQAPPPQNAANGLVEPLRVPPIEQPIVSTGRTCTVKYPEIILVCGT